MRILNVLTLITAAAGLACVASAAWCPALACGFAASCCQAVDVVITRTAR
jgi:hypothetical protein